MNKLAQNTDAQQLSRNLLLVPRATVNVKPNLQIIADDVKCTHGCAVSDLQEEELFYFRCEARGGDEKGGGVQGGLGGGRQDEGLLCLRSAVGDELCGNGRSLCIFSTRPKL